MQLEVITPDAKVFKGKVEAVQLPGKEGLFQILDHHAPMISTLGEGRVKISLGESHKKYGELNQKLQTEPGNDLVLYLPITGGVVEVQNDKVILLAD